MNQDEMIKDIERILIECCHFINYNNGLSHTKCFNCDYWDDTNNECASYERKQALAIYNADYRKIADDEVVVKKSNVLELEREVFKFAYEKGMHELAKKYGIDME